MKVRVESELCQGHTLCWMAAPDVFTLDEVDGHASAPDGDIPDDQIANVREAIKSCPERAIVEL